LRYSQRNLAVFFMKKPDHIPMRVIISIFVLLVFLSSCSEDEGTPLSITSVSPEKALVGASVTITGKGFSTTPSENLVKFVNIDAEVVSATETEIVTKVPAGAPTGAISVQVGGKTAHSPHNFTVQNLPEILHVYNVSHDIGGNFVFDSHYLGTDMMSNVVKFSGVAAEMVSVGTGTIPGDPIAMQQVTVKIPVAASGKVTVEYDGLEVTVVENFVINPYVTGFSPKGGPTGTQITVTGLNFVAGNVVVMGGYQANVISTTPTTMVAEVGANSRFGLLTVDNKMAPEYFMGTAFINHTPVSGPVGTWVDVFVTESPRSPRPIVKFNGVEATEVDTSNGIKARVPAGATTGKITLELGGFTSTSASNFTVQ